MCTERQLTCKDCGLTQTEIVTCAEYKRERERKESGWSHRKCSKFLETEEILDSYDKGHDCPAL